jgi:Ca2+-binding EF-hand superfamily protein
MKTRSGGSEEKEILNSFKYNDLNNKGRASYSDFLKLLSKFGVHTYSNTVKFSSAIK